MKRYSLFVALIAGCVGSVTAQQQCVLDDVMTKNEQTQSGVDKLTAVQQGALRDAIRRYGGEVLSKLIPMKGITVRLESGAKFIGPAQGEYKGVDEEHTVVNTHENKFLLLDDQSFWELPNNGSFLGKGDKLYIKSNGEADYSYTFFSLKQSAKGKFQGYNKK